MTDLSYSDSAINVRSRFLGCDNIVYVEGEDDILFWEFLFNKFTDSNLKIESVGGSPELDKFIEKIASGELSVIAARDSDYNKILGQHVPHKNIVYSYGYSIENSVITAGTIQSVIRLWSKGLKVPLENIDKWVDSFSKSIEPLAYYDIANELYHTSLSVLGNNCSRFMSDRTSPMIDDDKISGHVEKVSKKLNKEMYSEVETIVNGNNLFEIMRGHFVFSAALRFVNYSIGELRKRISIPTDAFYTNLIQAFEFLFKRGHPHYNYYKDAIRSCEIQA